MSLNQTLDLIEFWAASPLDQFGDDEDFEGLLSNDLLDFLPDGGFIEDAIDFTGLAELDSVGDWAIFALANSGNWTFDDEDSSDSEW